MASSMMSVSIPERRSKMTDGKMKHLRRNLQLKLLHVPEADQSCSQPPSFRSTFSSSFSCWSLLGQTWWFSRQDNRFPRPSFPTDTSRSPTVAPGRALELGLEGQQSHVPHQPGLREHHAGMVGLQQAQNRRPRSVTGRKHLIFNRKPTKISIKARLHFRSPHANVSRGANTTARLEPALRACVRDSWLELAHKPGSVVLAEESLTGMSDGD